MMSRLTALAVLFAVVTTASLAGTASAPRPTPTASAPAPVFVELPRVEITGHRIR